MQITRLIFMYGVHLANDSFNCNKFTCLTIFHECSRYANYPIIIIIIIIRTHATEYRLIVY